MGLALGDYEHPPWSPIFRGDTQIWHVYRGDIPVWHYLPKLYASDNFNRANSNGLGPDWSIYNAPAGNQTSVNSNTARSNVGTSDGVYWSRCRYDLVRANYDDQWVRARVAAVNNTGDNDLVSFLALRVQSATDFRYGAALVLVNNKVTIQSAINNTWTNRTATLSGFGAGDVFELQAQGRVFTALRNDSVIGSWNDAGNLSAMSASYRSGGLGTTSKRIFFSNSFSPSLDDWEFGDL